MIGSLLALIGFGLLARSGILGWGLATQRDDAGYFTTSKQRFAADSCALTSDKIDLCDPGPNGFGEWANATVRVTAADRTTLGALIIDATQAIIDDEQQSKDSFVWFRNNRDDIDTQMDGLTLDAQGLSPMVLAAAKIPPATSRTAGDAFWLDQTRTVHTATAATYGIVTVADPDDPAQQLTGGQLLQRIHLAATVAGLGLQHMNQITERDRDTSLSQPSKFATAMDALLGQPGQHALSTFRIGHPVRPGRLSPRRPVSEVTR